MKGMEPSVRIDRLNELMSKRGWGPGELAYHSNVKYDTIYKIRNNERPRTSAEILGSLAQALRSSVDYLLGLTDVSTPYSSGAVEDAEQIAGLLADLSPHRRNELLAVAEAIARNEREQRERMRRNLEVNRKLLDAVRSEVGQERFEELLALLGERIGLADDLLFESSGLLATQTPEQPVEDE